MTLLEKLEIIFSKNPIFARDKTLLKPFKQFLINFDICCIDINKSVRKTRAGFHVVMVAYNADTHDKNFVIHLVKNVGTDNWQTSFVPWFISNDRNLEVSMRRFNKKELYIKLES